MSIKSRLYFDHNATTYVSASVLQALKNVEEIYGNPSSVHWAGREARQLLNESRERMAAALNCHETELVFTSGATESTNHALVGLWESRHDLHQNEIISSPVEHHATLRTLSYLQSRGAQIQWIEIDSQGRLSRKDLKNKISSRTFCVSLMAVQNEIGNLYPIDSIAEICQSYGVIFHCDAVQAIGKINFQSQKNGPDLFSISAHKFHGPKGVGALYLRQGIKLAPFHHGGRQERSLRAGTENLLGIYGMSLALDECQQNLQKEASKLANLRDYFESTLLQNLPQVHIQGDRESRVSNTSNVLIEGVDGESLLFNLDLEGIAASAGAACESGSLDPSHVILAMGFSEAEAKASIRFSFDRSNTMEEVDRLLEVLSRLVFRLRK